MVNEGLMYLMGFVRMKENSAKVPKGLEKTLRILSLEHIAVNVTNHFGTVPHFLTIAANNSFNILIFSFYESV